MYSATKFFNFRGKIFNSLLNNYQIPLDWLPKREDRLEIGANNFQSTDDPLK